MCTCYRCAAHVGCVSCARWLLLLGAACAVPVWFLCDLPVGVTCGLPSSITYARPSRVMLRVCVTRVNPPCAVSLVSVLSVCFPAAVLSAAASPLCCLGVGCVCAAFRLHCCCRVSLTTSLPVQPECASCVCMCALPVWHCPAQVLAFPLCCAHLGGPRYLCSCGLCHLTAAGPRVICACPPCAGVLGVSWSVPVCARHCSTRSVCFACVQPVCAAPLRHLSLLLRVDISTRSMCVILK